MKVSYDGDDVCSGDGVRWRVHYTRVVDEDEEMADEDANREMR